MGAVMSVVLSGVIIRCKLLLCTVGHGRRRVDLGEVAPAVGKSVNLACARFCYICCIPSVEQGALIHSNLVSVCSDPQPTIERVEPENRYGKRRASGWPNSWDSDLCRESRTERTTVYNEAQAARVAQAVMDIHNDLSSHYSQLVAISTPHRHGCGDFPKVNRAQSRVRLDLTLHG
jgi:hypothetical protein